MKRPIHFEIHAPDPAATMAFYEKLFGWQFLKWDGPEEYWLVRTGEGPGINGGLVRSRDGQPRTVNTVDVSDLDATLKLVEGAGGAVVVPRMAIAGVGWLAFCSDPGGCIFGVIQKEQGAS